MTTHSEAQLKNAIRQQLHELLAEIVEIVRETRREMRGVQAIRSVQLQCDSTGNTSGAVPWIDVKDAAELFGMTHQSAKNSISRETFPVPTYKLGKRRVIDRKVLAAYFATKESEGYRTLHARHGGKSL